MISYINKLKSLKERRNQMKIKELRLLNLTIKQNDQIIYQGKTEDVPNDIKEQEYEKIYFQGVDVIIEIKSERKPKHELDQRAITGDLRKS